MSVVGEQDLIDQKWTHDTLFYVLYDLGILDAIRVALFIFCTPCGAWINWHKSFGILEVQMRTPLGAFLMASLGFSLDNLVNIWFSRLVRMSLLSNISCWFSSLLEEALSLTFMPLILGW